jgi:hypothetical protein
VGGTDYNVLGSQFSTYVSPQSSNSASTYYRTALGYIPENPWNDSPVTNDGPFSTNTPFKDSKGNTNILGGGGGLSNCVQSTQDNSGNVTCTAGGYAQPSFQSGVVPGSIAGSSPVRTLPDVSLLAADGAYGATWAICSDNVINGSSTASTDCDTSSGFSVTGVGGTSAAAPAFAGMLALVLHEEIARTSNTSLRFGQADNVLYNLAGQPALYATVFHDVTAGNNSVVCTSGSPDCGSNGFLTGFNAGTGYDAATGLGSVDVAQLATNWKNASFTSSSTTLQMGTSANSLSTNPSINVQHGTQLFFQVSVNPGSAGGDVAIVNNNTNNNSNGGALQNGGVMFPDSGLNFLTLSNGTASDSTNQLPGGTYQVTARYDGDNKNGGSTSNGITVNISPESSTTLLSVNIYDPSTGSSYTGPANSIPYGMFNFAVAQPVGNASTTNPDGSINADGVATGSVNFLDNNNALATSAIASNGVATYTNYQLASQTFPVGAHSFTAKYNGDASFSGSTSSAQAFTIVQAATTTAAASSATSVGSTATVTISVAVSADSLGAPPSGNVQLFNGSTAIGTATALTQGYSSSTGLVQSTASISVTGSQLTGSVKMAKQERHAVLWGISGGAAAMACVLFFAIPARRRSWRALLALIVFAIIVSGATACGGGSSSGGGGGGGNTATITAKYVGDTNYSASTSTAITITVTQ